MQFTTTNFVYDLFKTCIHFNYVTCIIKLLSMKKNLIYIIAFLPILFSCNQNKLEKYETEESMTKRDRMDLAWAQEMEMTKDLATGEVPKERLLQAYNDMQNQGSNLIAGAIPNLNWVELGPKNCGGRTRTLCVDLNDPTGKTVFAGSVSGGIWKTTDITAAEPNWVAVNNLFGNIAISYIIQDPVNKQNIYFSTGEGYGNLGSQRGIGIWKSADGGVTWNQLAATNNLSYYYCQKMAVNATGHLFVGTSTGLYRSTDAGATFNRLLGFGLAPGITTSFVYDVDIATNGDVYASMRGGTLHKSTDNGNTFSSPLPVPAGIISNRIEIGLAKTDANTIYILTEKSNKAGGFAVSSNGGNSFTLKTLPADADPGIGAADFTRGQAWYDLTIAVDPTNKSIVYVGGVDLFKTTDEGNNWQQISHWYGGFGFQNVHADQHGIVFSPVGNNVAYFVNDGAMYRSDNTNATIPTLVGKEINYNTTQFYGCAMSPLAGTFNFMAGAQDNGTHKLSVNGISNSAEVTGGDGMFCHIDQNEPQYWFSSYVYNNYYRSTNGGNTFNSIFGGNSRGRFVNPTDYDNQANILYCADSTGSYAMLLNATAGNTLTNVVVPEFGGQVSCITVSPNTSNRVFFGTGVGKIVRIDNANTGNGLATVISAGLPSAYLSCIEIETGNDNHMIATFSNYGTNSIWETINGGTSWTSVEGNLPDFPVRWALFNPANNAQLLVATELGVWSTDLLNGASTNWAASNNGLANVRVDMLQIRQSDKLVIAATYGRGLFYTGAFVSNIADFNVPTQVIYVERALKFNNVSIGANSQNWNFGDGTTSTEISPIKKYSNPGVYTVTLSINNGASTKVKTITVLPNKFTPYLISNGGNFEINTNDFAAESTNTGTKWERGASVVSGKSGVNSGTSAWVTGIVGNYTDNAESYLYTPNYNFTTPGTYDFSFYTKYKVEADYDGMIVEYSLDTGKTWIALGNTIQANWYNFANATGGTAFSTGQAFFTGTQASFVKKNYNVSSLAGNKNVAFRFAFKADGGVVDAGIVIDDVEIIGPPTTQFLFTVEKQNKDALLKWNTLAINASSFVVERSWDGINFIDIGTVAAQPISNIIQNYSYVDLLSNVVKWPSNTTHYRVRSINNNNTSLRTNILKLDWDNTIVGLSITPNPFISSLNINTLSKILNVSLVAANGQIVYSSNNVLNNSLFIPNFIANGTYFIRVNTDKGLFVEKIIKIGN